MCGLAQPSAKHEKKQLNIFIRSIRSHIRERRVLNHVEFTCGLSMY